MSDDLPTNGWDMVAQMAVDKGMNLADARDLVIGYFLRSGDMRPFSDWILRGHSPSQRVLQCVALMACEKISPESEDALPFALVRRKRRPGKKNSRPDPEVEIYHERLAELVNDAGAGEPGLYDAAIETVVDLLGDQKKKQTVRDAYDPRFSKKTKRSKPLR